MAPACTRLDRSSITFRSTSVSCGRPVTPTTTTWSVKIAEGEGGSGEAAIQRSPAKVPASRSSSATQRAERRTSPSAYTRTERKLSTLVKKGRPSSVGPVSGSTLCSGCGINPTTLPRSLQMPAMSRRAPFGLPLR